MWHQIKILVLIFKMVIWLEKNKNFIHIIIMIKIKAIKSKGRLLDISYISIILFVVN